MIARPLCGSPLRGRTHLRCRGRPIKGHTRCRFHGGRSPSWVGPRTVKPAQAARSLKQALFKSWGIPWYGGKRKTPQPKEAMAIMADAIVKADAVLETLPALVDKPDDQKTSGELLNEGMRVGLTLARDACVYASKHLATIQAAGLMVAGEDLKVLRWGTDTAGWLTRASVRVVEGEFRARRDDVLGRLLEQVAAKGHDEKGC